MTITASRTARPTTDLDRVRNFYVELVGLPEVFAFSDHDGFDGVILGVPDARAQLELVRTPGAEVAPRPTAEDQLVLYFDTPESRDEVVDRLRAAGFAPLAEDDPTVNPYWPNVSAVIVVDPDGYRLVLTTG